MTALIRPARPTDAGATGEILHTRLEEASPGQGLYSGAQAIAFCGQMIGRDWVRVAEHDGAVQGFLAREQGYIHALYLAPGACGAGIGRRLIEDARRTRDQLRLRVLSANTGARRFYTRLGFAETDRGDGRDNDENLPDIGYEWRREAT
ncbi:Ribosomal protein S18 acetylase RimI [Salinihabitans flavidus]|uniref:Ribosomal protein S18 acetylase RimI n=1 Tax=Salinihabitans flavidus TaxID=569882 RepID=A0A1H8VHW1_9RHOB|nr:GNAT family N-acetyltransferase [Salinihabitans flavidus]SEP14894.1 Ribosomal protein S18 acetylase RimI [Salinihabitans flavidus]